jgi:alginate O-acetyltransferase complex protein AlgI
MFFNSPAYLGFFLVVFALYWALPWQRPRVWFLVAASIAFYAVWSQLLALLVVTTAVMDFLLARGMDAWQGPRLRRLLLGTSLAVNLGLLGFFKYSNFFLDSLGEALRALGADASLPTLQLMVPFGISFYTFEAISYTLDVYHRRIRAERSLPSFLLFILFFPHLVAGPIVRAGDFLPQTHAPRRFNWLRAQVGVQLFLLGLFKKVLADRLAEYSDPVFRDPGAFGPLATWMAVFAFTARIYCDFSGYSDMALGSAHLLGYKLATNFNYPYLATNIADFWRRWHISLSTWLRDYIFHPLGGSRGGTFATCRNLMITLTLGGLWHGAAWTFVLYGALHGLFLVVHRLFRSACDRSPLAVAWRETWPARVIGWALTMLCFGLTFILFQPSLAVAGELFLHLVGGSAGALPALSVRGLILLLALVVALHAVAFWPVLRRWAVRVPGPLLGMSQAALLVLILVLGPKQGTTFIYFQF